MAAADPAAAAAAPGSAVSGGAATGLRLLSLAPDPRVSPCTGVCRLDPAGRFCTGCARSTAEITGWGAASPAERASVWARLPARRAELGLGVRRLAWGPAQILELIRVSLTERVGAWVLGVPGGLAEFTIGGGEALELDVAGPVVSAVTPRGALRLVVGDGVRALYGPGSAARPEPVDGAGTTGPVVLVAPRPARPRRPRWVVTALGPDQGAVGARGQGVAHFDLGLGSPVARFGLRTDDASLLRALQAAEGRRWTELVAAHGPALLAVSPERVVESALGRVEVATPIPPPGGRSPDGPHTHLLPEVLDEGRDAPAGLDVPAGWQIGAIWYPGEPAVPT